MARGWGEGVSRQDWSAIIVFSALAGGIVFWMLRANAPEGSSPVVPIVTGLVTWAVGVIALMVLYRWRSNR